MTAPKYNDNDCNYLHALIAPLVTDESAITMQRELDQRGVHITLGVGLNDMGKIIGREGKTAMAIRHLLHQFGMGGEQRTIIQLTILEPQGSTRGYKKPGFTA